MSEQFGIWQLGSIVLVAWVFYTVLYYGYFKSFGETPEASPSNPSVSTDQQEAKRKKRAKKPADGEKIQPKPKNLHKIVPLGKSAFCKYCEVYMEDDDFLNSHESGKKHQKNCRKIDLKWFTIVDPPQLESKPLTLQPVETEEGWTLISKKPKSKQST